MFWFFAGLILAALLISVSRIWLDGSPPEWLRLILVANAVVVTFLPTGWALESVDTVRKAMEAGLEHPELARMKIEYLERFGEGGGNPVARRWGMFSVILFLAWLLAGSWVLPKFGFGDLFLIASLDGAFVIGFGIAATLRVRAYQLLAESRGYPMMKLALELRKQGVRS